MNNIITKVSQQKAIIYNGCNVNPLNTYKKSFNFIKLLDKGFIDNIDYLKNIYLYNDEPLYSAIEKINYPRFCKIIETYSNADLCFFENDYLTIRFSAQQTDIFKVYNIHTSFLPWLEKECSIACYLYIECLRVLNSLGVYIHEHRFCIEDSWEDYIIESKESFIENATDGIERNNAILAIYKEMIKPYDNDMYNTIYEAPCKKSFQTNLKALNINTQFNYHLKIFANEVFKLFDSYGMNYYEYDSVKAFMDDNYITSDDEEQMPLLYRDLFYVSHEDSDYIGNILTESINCFYNEYGFADFFMDFKIHSWKDYMKIKDMDKSKFRVLTLLPKIFELGLAFCESVELYFNEKYIEKWIKEMPKEYRNMMKYPADTL